MHTILSLLRKTPPDCWSAVTTGSHNEDVVVVVEPPPAR